MIVGVLRDYLRVRRMVKLMHADRLGEVLARPLPKRWGRCNGLLVQATAAYLTGDHLRAESLLDEATRIEPGEDRFVRLPLLLGLGRYGEAAAQLGDNPLPPDERQLRAYLAIEQGDDALAERLLQPVGEQGVDEATRLRALGILRARRGRWQEAEALLGQSLEQLDALRSDMPALVVGMGSTHHSLAVGATAVGDLERARAEVATAVEILGSHGLYAPGIASAHALAAKILALAGDLPDAAHHLTEARSVADSIVSPPLQAEVLASAAEVAWARGDHDDARARLTEAREIHAQLGAAPARDAATARLAEWAAS